MDSKQSMDLKVMYCSDLKAFNFFQKLQVYVLVSLVSNDPEKKLKQNQQHRTTTDAEDDENPEWNHEMHFDLSEVSFVDCDHLFIHFDLYHEGLYFGDKVIGEVRVPLKDLIQESSGILRFANYQVRSPDGKPNGILNFSYKINVMPNDMGINSSSTASQISGYPVVVHHHHHHHQSPESPYPSPEVENSNSSHTISYPSLQLPNNSQEIYPAVAPVTYPPHETHYPPTSYGYYPPPLPHHEPPPPPACGACYPPPYRPGFRPCTPGEVYGCGPCGTCNSTGVQPYTFGQGGRWRHDSHGYR